MTEIANARKVDSTLATQPGFQISVNNFGPIKSGSVEVRPLTVLVGPSNTGKTYFAILLYALHKSFGGFPLLPILFQYEHRFFRQSEKVKRSATPADTLATELQDILTKLEEKGRSLRYSDLPMSVRALTVDHLTNPHSFGTILTATLERCFDLDTVSELVSFPGDSRMGVTLEAKEEAKQLWRFHLEVLAEDVETSGSIQDSILIAREGSARAAEVREGMIEFKDFIDERKGVGDVWNSQFLLDLFEQVLKRGFGSLEENQIHYLPAARSGIMQSHRVIASSLVARSVRGGLERFPEVPTFSGVMADFMQKLILFNERNRGKDTLTDLADILESEALTGQIRSSQPPAGGYPEFVYRPNEAEEDIRLTRASSMVSELAPVVLFLRGAVSPGDMLIIEEPEAHLHPAAQTQIAKILARLVRAGVKVVVTTHSDWLLMEIGNLIREGELADLTSDSEREDSQSSLLRPSEVGVWLFRESDASMGSTIEEIPFDRTEGVEPSEYEDVAEALYNRSAALQNRFQEVAGAATREQE